MTSGKWFGFSFHFFNVSEIFLLSIISQLYFRVRMYIFPATFAIFNVIFPATFAIFNVIFPATFKRTVRFSMKHQAQKEHFSKEFTAQKQALFQNHLIQTAENPDFLTFFHLRVFFCYSNSHFFFAHHIIGCRLRAKVQG